MNKFEYLSTLHTRNAEQSEWLDNMNTVASISHNRSPQMLSLFKEVMQLCREADT